MENDEDKIPWCSKGYTIGESKVKCPLGGCWKYRCRFSTLNKGWHKEREEWRQKQYDKVTNQMSRIDDDEKKVW